MRNEILIYNKTHSRISEKFIKFVILKALRFLKLKQPVELAVLIVSEKEITRINKVWRGKNKPADELSFGLNSHLPAGGSKFAKDYGNMLSLGEIVLNVLKISNKDCLSQLLVHSLLHLLGYHHEKSAVQAEKMEKLEEKILKHLKV